MTRRDVVAAIAGQVKSLAPIPYTVGIGAKPCGMVALPWWVRKS